MRESFLQKVRQAAIELGEFTINDLTIALPVCTYEDKEKARRSVKSLKRSGEAISLRPGLYRYIGKDKTLNKLARMWRAMRIKGYFTRQDIGRLSGASKTHVHKYFMYLERKGIIENSSGGRGYKGGVYCLIDQDNAPLEHPKIPKYKARNNEHRTTKRAK